MKPKHLIFSLLAMFASFSAKAANGDTFTVSIGDTDGIEEFQGTPLPNRGGAGGEALFDLSGRKVERLSRGIYINGTRKVVIK